MPISFPETPAFGGEQQRLNNEVDPIQPASPAIWIRRATIATGLAVCACGSPPSARTPPATPPSSAERGYTPPPELVSSSRMAGGHLLLEGTAPPTSRVRLATPSGAAVFALTGKDGLWRAVIPVAADLRLFGLSAVTPGRTVQSEGYLAVTPGGEAAQLRSGSGARALVVQRPGVSLIAADFDRKGGTVISGLAPAGAQVGVTVDDKPGGVTRTDGQGRFLLALNEPLKPGTHSILAQGAGAQARAVLMVSVPTRPAQGPFEAQSVDGSWRIDWLTPGGGMQSTVLFPRPGPAT